MSKEDYINAVKGFNSLESFHIVLPDDEQLYDQLAKYYTDNIKNITDLLETYETYRKKGMVDNDISTRLCAFVVHINQISKKVKRIDEPMVLFH